MPVRPHDTAKMVNTVIDRRTPRQFVNAVVYTIDGTTVTLRPTRSTGLVRNVEVIGAIDDLSVGQEVQVIWKRGRPYVLSATTIGGLMQYFPPDNVTIENSSEGLRVKQGSLQTSHMGFAPALVGHQHEELEGAITAIIPGPGINVSGAAVSISGNTIMRYHASGALAKEWSADADGLDHALESAMCGDLVVVPAKQLITSAGGVTIPDGVTLRGVSKTRSVIKGSVYGGDNSVLEDCSVWIKDSDPVELVGIYGPNTGEQFRVNNVIVSVENKHNVSGDAYGVYATLGLLRLENVTIEAIAFSGTAWAGWGEAAGARSTILAIGCHIDVNTPWFAGGGVSIYNCLMEERTSNLFCDYVDAWLYVVTQARLARTQNPLAPNPADVAWENLTDVITGTIVDFAIDPVDRDVAWCTTTTGMWGTTNLRAAVVSWVLLKTPAQFQAALGHGSLVYPRGLAVASGKVWVFLDPTSDGIGKGIWVGRYDGAWFYTSQLGLGVNMNSNGQGPIAVSPHNTDVIWISWCNGAVASGMMLMKSTDGGASWAESVTGYGAFNVAYRIVIPVADNENSGVVYVTTTSANPLVTTNGGSTWTDTKDPGGCSRSYVFDVGNDSRDNQVAAVTGGTLYVSTNGGTNWTSRGALGAQKACVFEADRNIMFYTTTGAPFASIDFGLTMVNIIGDYAVAVGVFTNPVAMMTVAD